MIIGDVNTLKVARLSSIGPFLEDDMGLEVLLPKRYVPAETNIGDQIDVFIYRDSEDRLIATTETPLARVNQLARLKVIATGPHGAFLDWGLPKDLFVPLKEQSPKMHEGEMHLVYVYLDDLTQRLVASNRLDRFLSPSTKELEHGTEVNIEIWKSHELGYQVVVNGAHPGMLYANQLFKDVSIGDTFNAWVNQIRDDGKIDVLLQKPGYGFIADHAATEVLKALESNNGFLSLHDKSHPDDIRDRLQLSKKAFKKAVGALMKARKIELTEDGIKLI